MSKPTRGWVRLSVVLALTAICAVVVVVPELQRSDVADARAWAAGLSHDQRANAVEQIGSYTIVKRRALYTTLTMEQRAGLWTRNIREYQEAHPSLSAETQATLEALLAFTTPERFGQLDKSDDAAILALAKTLKAQIGAEAAQVVLTMPGGPPVSSSESFITTFLRRHFVVVARSRDCACSTASDWCGAPDICMHYKQSGCSVPAHEHCGTFYHYTCDGECCLPDPEGGCFGAK